MAQSQSSNDFVILLDVRLLQVIEQTSTVLDHFQQSASRMIVFLVCLEVLGEFGNALTQKRDLYLGRTRVAVVFAKIGNDLFFRFFC